MAELMQFTDLERLNNAKKNEEILKGKLIKIEQDGALIVKIEGLDKEVRGHIALENSTLYVPNYYKIIEDNEFKGLTRRGKDSLVDYLGATISFCIDDEIIDAEGKLKSLISVSMKKAKIKTVTDLESGKQKYPCRVKVNILAARKDFLVVEYNGVIQTISEGYLSYREIPNVKDYYKAHKEDLDEFMIIDASTARGFITLDRKPVVGNVFKKKVIEKREYKKGDSCIGKVIGKTDAGHIFVEIEAEIIGTALLPEGLPVRFGSEIKCTVIGSKVHASSKSHIKRGKLLLGDIRL